MKNLRREIELIKQSNLFDEDWYIEQYPDVKILDMDPVEHYLRFGTLLLRNPSQRFDSKQYLEENLSIAEVGVNPLIHYLRNGADETLKPIMPGTCLIVTPPHTLFYARLLKRMLCLEDFSVTVCLDLADCNRYEHVFIFCTQMFDILPNNYIAIQMEQSGTSRWFTDDYFAKLRSARAVIDYSLHNIDYLESKGFNPAKLYYIPLDVDRQLYDKAAKSFSTTERKGCVLFYGDDKCERRQYFLDRLKKYFNLKIINNAFSDDIVREILKSKLVVNIHYYEDSLLETTRIFEVLSLGVPVVSEKSRDFDHHSDLHSVVKFVDMGDVDQMIKAIQELLRNNDLYSQKLNDIKYFVNDGGNRFEYYFGRFLLGRNIITFDSFLSRVQFYSPLPSSKPKICLSLPETPSRKKAFLSQQTHGFMLWDGLKTEPGWVGCALSYKHLFITLLRNHVHSVVICEDDVLFGDDFETRYQKVVDYLKKQDQWDIFSGFIADIHPDTKVLKVEEFDGERFVYIDRTVSMVFNVYNRDIMQYLSEWDPSDTDVEKNTIDRYLQRRDGTVVITTCPFLVSHREDANSTIWGFQNTQYNELVKRSEQLLTQKIDEFERQSKQ